MMILCARIAHNPIHRWIYSWIYYVPNMRPDEVLFFKLGLFFKQDLFFKLDLFFKQAGRPGRPKSPSPIARRLSGGNAAGYGSVFC